MSLDESDTDGWSAWLDRYGSALLLYARQLTPTAADAEDVVQDAFVRFWRSRQTASDRLTYLFTCVKSCALDHRRGERRRARREMAAGAESRTALASPLDLAQHAERLRSVDAALSGLPEEQREVFVMKTCTALTFAQIGQVLEISANTAASRYRYACEALRAKLAREVMP